MNKNIAILLFFLSAIVPHFHRVFNNSQIEYIYPFFFGPGIKITTQWYVKDIGDGVGFILLTASFYFAFFSLYQFLSWQKPPHHYRGALIFSSLLMALSGMAAVFSVIDLLNYLFFYRRSELTFLICNGLFFVFAVFRTVKYYKARK